MWTLRWIILTLGVLGGALGLAATSTAAMLPASAAVAGSIGEGTVTQATGAAAAGATDGAGAIAAIGTDGIGVTAVRFIGPGADAAGSTGKGPNLLFKGS